MTSGQAQPPREGRRVYRMNGSALVHNLCGTFLAHLSHGRRRLTVPRWSTIYAAHFWRTYRPRWRMTSGRAQPSREAGASIAWTTAIDRAAQVHNLHPAFLAHLSHGRQRLTVPRRFTICTPHFWRTYRLRQKLTAAHGRSRLLYRACGRFRGMPGAFPALLVRKRVRTASVARPASTAPDRAFPRGNPVAPPFPCKTLPGTARARHSQGRADT